MSRTFLMVALLTTVAAGAWGAISFGYLTEIAEDGEFAQAKACGECHGPMYREWLDSPHARAFSSPSFRATTDDYEFSACLNCHAPEPTLKGSPPATRKFARGEGVTCVSCHLEAGKLWGPFEPTGLRPPHPVGVDADRYRDARFCGRCHEGTLAEWQAADMDEKPTCQKCHMPPVTRKMTEATSLLSKPFIALEKAVPQGRHSFTPVPAELDSPPFAIEGERSGATVTLTIHNHMPHSLPPGDFGVRVVVIEVQAIDGKGATTPIARRELVKETGSAVAARSALKWKIPAPPNSRALRVRMWRHGRGGAGAAELIRTEVSLQ